MKIKNDNILVIKHGSLGDIIQADGIFRAIKEAHPDSYITLMTTSIYSSLMQKSPYIDQIIIDDRPPLWKIINFISLYKRLKSYRFKVVYDLQNSQRTSFYKRYFAKNASWVTTERRHHPTSGLRGLSEMLKDRGINNKNLLKPDIKWLANNAENLLNQNKIEQRYILLLPGSSRSHKEKRWPYYSDLASLLIKNKYCVVSVLGPDELELATKIPGHILTNLNWEELAGVVQKACYIIGNDSGPCHIASCLNKKGIALFGPKTSSIRSELKRGNFSVIKTENLWELSVEKIYSIAIESITT